MKVIHVTSSCSTSGGGISSVIWEMATQHLQMGIIPVIVSLKSRNKAKIPNDRPFIALYEEPVLGPRCWGFSKALRIRLAKEIVDSNIIHSHGLWKYPNYAACELARKFRRPLIVTPHGMLEPWAWNYHWWKKRPIWWMWEKRNSGRASILHATSEEEAESLRSLGLNNPIAVIANGVDIPKFIEENEQDRVRTLLFLSRIHPKKGLINLLKAWSILRPRGWRVVIAGPDQNGHEKEVKSTVQKLGLKSQFEFIGPVYGNTKWNLYHTASLFILPTSSENFGLVIAEALASGTPVITTKGAPWRELEEYDCGWWVENNAESIANALRTAIELSDTERTEMGLRGRELVKKRYSWSNVSLQMLTLYKWILGQADKPSFVRLD